MLFLLVNFGLKKLPSKIKTIIYNNKIMFNTKIKSDYLNSCSSGGGGDYKNTNGKSFESINYNNNNNNLKYQNYDNNIKNRGKLKLNGKSNVSSGGSFGGTSGTILIIIVICIIALKLAFLLGKKYIYLCEFIL